VYINSRLTPEGHIWQFGVPKFDNFTYAYHIQPLRVMLTSKVLTTLSSHQSLHPYFSWELGAAFNRANNYHETPIIPLVAPMSPFSSHTETSFAWGLGIGMDYNVTQHVRAGIGYQFSNLGAASLGSTSAATTNQTLSLSHLYTNQLRFQLTFLA
jgi:opacity protein-like surface antigen